MTWREAAVVDALGLKPHFVRRHGWAPRVSEGSGHVDLVVSLRGHRLPGRRFALRLRYLPDWQAAGRREAFVDPSNPDVEGSRFWPPEGAIRGVNPNYRPTGIGEVVPCVCLRGVFGYHSVLHANERPTGTTALGFLLELQAVMDE